MEDWRDSRLKILRILFFIFLVLIIIWTIIFILVSDSLKSAEANSTFGSIGLMLSFFIIIITFLIESRQEMTALELSKLENDLEEEKNKNIMKIKYMEESIEKFYSPLFILISSGSLDIKKLQNINCHRYLANQKILCFFDPFYAECIVTNQLPVNTTNILLQNIKTKIDDLNKNLTEEYKKIK